MEEIEYHPILVYPIHNVIVILKYQDMQDINHRVQPIIRILRLENIVSVLNDNYEWLLYVMI